MTKRKIVRCQVVGLKKQVKNGLKSYGVCPALRGIQKEVKKQARREKDVYRRKKKGWANESF